MKKIVITGGSYAGRTTTVEELGRQGFSTVSEAAEQIIQKLNREYGVEGQKNGAWNTSKNSR